MDTKGEFVRDPNGLDEAGCGGAWRAGAPDCVGIGTTGGSSSSGAPVVGSSDEVGGGT
jgi:hypothetical protein